MQKTGLRGIFICTPLDDGFKVFFFIRLELHEVAGIKVNYT